MTDNNHIVLALDKYALGTYSEDYILDDTYFAALEQDEILGGQCTAHVEMVVREESFALHLEVNGTVQVTCDRCLDPMDCDVEPFEEDFLLKLAQEDGEDDDAIYVNREHPDFHLGWLLYEVIAVRLPVVHSHQSGECNAQMEALLQSHLCTDLAAPEE